MAKVSKPEVVYFKNGFRINDVALLMEAQSIKNEKSSINTFIQESESKLKGEGYDAMRKIMLPLYVDLLDRRDKCRDLLNTIINTIGDNWQLYMQSYELLDDAKLPDLYYERSRLESAIKSLDISHSFNFQLYQKYTEELNAINELIALLEGISPKDSELLENIRSFEELYNDYNNRVKNLASSFIGFSSIDSQIETTI